MPWWIDPATGEIGPHVPDVDVDETPGEDGWTWIEPERNEGADYAEGPTPAADVPASIADAESFVGAVEHWSAHHDR